LGAARTRLKFILPAVFALLAVASYPLWLRWLGESLVLSEPPFRAGIAVVLAGDGSGNRLIRAAELVREGYAPRVLVSGPPGFYGRHESDLAVTFAVERRYPESWFIRLPHQAHSTRDEVAVIVSELRRRGIRRFLVVTSDYHTRRAARIFRERAAGLDFRMIAAPDRFFRAGSWWRDRQGRKVFLFEWLKTITERFGL